jgi:DNA-binding CsgD family transcriptional regulator
MDNPISLSRISTREREIIRLIAKGLTTKQIGLLLHISPTTVITHRNNLRNKLRCKNCPEMIFKATKLGII